MVEGNDLMVDIKTGISYKVYHNTFINAFKSEPGVEHKSNALNGVIIHENHFNIIKSTCILATKIKIILCSTLRDESIYHYRMESNSSECPVR